MCELCVCFAANAPRSQPQGAGANALKAGWDGRSRLTFPQERVWSPQAPPTAPRAQMCPLQYTSVRSFPSQFQAPLSTKSDTKTLVHSNEKEKTVQIPIVGENTEHFDSNTPKTGVQIASVIWGGSNDHQVKGRNTQPHPELCNRGENCV